MIRTKLDALVACFAIMAVASVIMLAWHDNTQAEIEKEKTNQEAIRAGLVQKREGMSLTPIWGKF